MNPTEVLSAVNGSNRSSISVSAVNVSEVESNRLPIDDLRHLKFPKKSTIELLSANLPKKAISESLSATPGEQMGIERRRHRRSSTEPLTPNGLER
jgi:hypothetical protein